MKACSPSSGPRGRDKVAALYQEHHAWLRSWLGYRLHAWGRCVAEDLAHDIFVRMLATHGLGETIERPRAYLAVAARGVLISWLRRQSLEHAWLETLRALPLAMHPSPERQALVLEALHGIDAALDTLRPCIKRAFLMAVLGGMKQRDIAIAMDIAIPTVKRYMRQAYVACLHLMPDD
ncbi:sigma-70 family RNA polymerase sigma factor [Bordetella bronchiseptica]|uniref:RNA polymerase subunit sigma n=1 Tax=Bordetella genomosp. 6 TaxID=463024 RepID=A0ABX4FBF5_9BORD|nr:MULTISPECIES: sigma-70 family RNA polymerase sigma factor [Bordetella]MBN3265918.1 RNA polymerase subunit sigma [Bordetella bronchiseptica]OZI76902.1 RNA polymerase subunit sigma [Bordetella genomosp. 6]